MKLTRTKLVEWTTKQKQYNNIPRNIWKNYSDTKPHNTSKLKICLYVNPCGGNGDVIFATKLYMYLTSWYKCSIHIATTKSKAFLQNKIINIKKLLCLKIPQQPAEECLLTNSLSVYDYQCSKKLSQKDIEKLNFDLYFVAPWVSSEVFNYHSLKNVFPQANAFNTYIFSAYNQDTVATDQPFDFITGLGKNRLGLLYTDIKTLDHKTLLKKIKGDFIITHLSQSEHITKNEPLDCLSNFLKTIFKKYNKHKNNISILTPPFFQTYPDHFENIARKHKITLEFYTPNYIYTFDYASDNTNTTPKFIIRTDILPVPLSQFYTLLKYSLPDILLTGNQSLTDLLSIRQDTILYYQLMPWEINFSKQLKNLTKLNYISSKKNSCGTLNIPIGKINYKKVLQQDFRELAKPKLDAIISFAIDKQNNEYLQEYIQTYQSSRNKNSFLKKIT